jgi:hypothetical protein
MEADAEQGVVSRLHEMGCIPLRIAVPGDRLIAGSQTRLPLLLKRKVNQQQLPNSPKNSVPFWGWAANRSQSFTACQFDRRGGFYQGDADSSGGGARR